MTYDPDDGRNVDHYEVFGLTSKSSQDEIKKRHQELLLRFHPDKQTQTESRKPSSSSLENFPTSLEDRFHILETSWKVLRDPVTRQKYDAQRTQKDKLQDHPIGEVVRLNEMTEEVDDGEEGGVVSWSHPCRCGGEYVLCSDYDAYEELIEDPNCLVTICCTDCSLAISVSA